MSERYIINDYKCEPYNGNDPFLFVSYLHAEWSRVEPSVNFFHRNGFRIWYDGANADHSGINAGEKWLEKIYSRINESFAFLCFLSKGTQFREVVLGEIEHAINMKKEKNYVVVFVLLDRVSINIFPPKIKENLNDCQFIKLYECKRINKKIANRLLDIGWPSAIVDDTYRENHGLAPWKANASDRVKEPYKSFFSDDETEMLRKNFDKVSVDQYTFEIYKLYPEDIDNTIVYPIAMDDQWLNGIGISNEKILKCQKKEFFSALLHNRYIVLNRAFVVNSKIFINWYSTSADFESRDTFKKLMSDGAVILYLMGEKSPLPNLNRLHIEKENLEQWSQFCQGVHLFTLRFDWNDESNKFECDKLLTHEFENFCITTSFDNHRIEFLANLLNINDSSKDGFLDVWHSIRETILLKKKKEPESNYSRVSFYKDFIIDGDSLKDWHFDCNKHYAKELKQIIDFIYCSNLASSLGISPLLPGESPFEGYFLFEQSVNSRAPRLYIDDLEFLIDDFLPERLISSDISFEVSDNISLSDIYALRQYPAWKNYVLSIEEAKHRFAVGLTDLYASLDIWKEFHNLLIEASYDIDSISNIKKENALSIIYNFEGSLVITVYKKKSKYVYYNGDKTIKPRKMGVSISYMYGDASCYYQSSPPANSNILQVPICLFSGVTAESGTEIYEALRKKLTENNFERSVIPK